MHTIKDIKYMLIGIFFVMASLSMTVLYTVSEQEPSLLQIGVIVGVFGTINLLYGFVEKGEKEVVNNG